MLKLNEISVKLFLHSAAVAGVLLSSSCKGSKPSTFVVTRIDHHVTGGSQLPLAVEPGRVGLYPPETKSGAGYFYDEVLEYRVWLHPENGAEPLNGSKDYFAAFAQYEVAKDFSDKTPGAEEPLALVRQFEWIDEPKQGEFVPKKGERVTEWQVVWLKDGKRSKTSIEEFLKHPHEADPSEGSATSTDH